MLAMAIAKTPKTRASRPRGRPPAPADVPPAERTTFNLPAGTRERVKRAQALLTVLGEKSPPDLTSFVVEAVDRLVRDIEARARTRGIP